MLSYHDIIELGLALGPPKFLLTLCFVKHKQAEVRCILLFSNLSLGPNGVHTLVSFISYNLRAQASLVGKWESCSPPELNHQKKNEKEKERRLITGGCFYAIITRIKEPQNYNKIWMEIWMLSAVFLLNGNLDCIFPTLVTTKIQHEYYCHHSLH